MRRISAVGAIAAFLITAAAGWAAPPKPAPDSPGKTPTHTRQEVAKSLEIEQKTYLERTRFCIRLREIAAETGDEKLLQKADTLEQEAFDLYMKKTAPLKSLVEQIKATEAHLEERRNSPTPATGTASTGGSSSNTRITGRAPNGRPIISKE